MSKSFHKTLESIIAKKAEKKRQIAEAERKADYDTLLSLLDSELSKLLVEVSEFEALYIDNELALQFYNPNLCEWAKDLGFSTLAECDGFILTFKLAIPKFISGNNTKMTAAQKRLRTFNGKLKSRKRQLRANAEAICKVLIQKIIDEDFELGDDEKTITVSYVRPDRKPLIPYEVLYITNFFAKRKVQFEACSVPGIYKFSL